MSSMEKGKVSLDEFRRAVHNTISQEPFAIRFAELSMSGDRRGMIEMLMEMPYVAELRPGDSYQGKNDAQAARLYEELCEATTMERLGDDERGAKDTEARDLLTKVLFTASANNRVFLDAICERARCSYSLRCYASCMKDCECMLAFPTSLYDDSAENIKYFVQHRKECLQLERVCSKNLAATSTGKRGVRHGRASSAISPVISNTRMLSGKRAIVTTSPNIDGRQHRYLTSCSDSVALRFNVSRGRHLVATRDIKPGAVLIVDRSFSCSTDASALGRNCLHCHATLKVEDSVRIPCRNCQTVSFCSEVCRREAWEAYHQYECSIFDYFFENPSNSEYQRTSHLLLAYRTTVMQALSANISRQGGTETKYILNSDFLQYHANGNAKNDNNDVSTELGRKKPYSPLDYQTVFQLETHCVDIEPNVNLIRTIEAIFLAKCLIHILNKLDIICTRETFVTLAVATLHHLQMINCNAYEIIENVYDEETHVWEPRNIGGAIYTTVSLVNHSCYPNVVRHSYPNGIVVVRALRSIAEGCEILDCYGPQFLSESRLTRRELLWKKYRFLCACDACTHNWKLPLPEMINYKCTVCSEPMDLSTNVNVQKTCQQCTKCQKTIDVRKIERQLYKSVQKRLKAVTEMYEGNYRNAIPLLLEHAYFASKHLIEPNMEGIKTEQCIIQCYNSLSSTSVR